MNGGLFYQPDDVADRARAAGKTASEYLREAEKRRKAKLMGTKASLMARVTALESRLDEERERTNRMAEKAMDALEAERERSKKEAFRASWGVMVLLAEREAHRKRWNCETLGPVQPPKPEILIAEIIEQVGALAGISAAEIRSSARTRPVTRARQVVCWRARNETKKTLHQVAKAIRRRDHTTVLHGVLKVEEALRRGEHWALYLTGRLL